jgi:hypothetical protein
MPNLYEVTDEHGHVVLVEAIDWSQAEWKARRKFGLVGVSAKLWRTVPWSDDADETARRLAVAVSEWELEGTVESQGDVAPVGRISGDTVAPTRREPTDTVAQSPHDVVGRSEARPYVQAAPGRANEATVSHAKAPNISNIGRNRGGRPVRGLKSPIPANVLLYYRPGDGFKEDLVLILTKTGIGPAGLGRALGVDRRQIHRWRRDGMPVRMDPVVFLQVFWWAYLLRGGKYGWQR